MDLSWLVAFAQENEMTKTWKNHRSLVFCSIFCTSGKKNKQTCFKHIPSCSEGLWHYELWIDGNPDLEDQYISDASKLFKKRQRKCPPFWPPRPLLFQVPQRCFNCTGAPGKKWGLRREFGRDFWVEVSWVLFLGWQQNLEICETNIDSKMLGRLYDLGDDYLRQWHLGGKNETPQVAIF